MSSSPKTTNGKDKKELENKFFAWTAGGKFLLLYYIYLKLTQYLKKKKDNSLTRCHTFKHITRRKKC